MEFTESDRMETESDERETKSENMETEAESPDESICAGFQLYSTQTSDSSPVTFLQSPSTSLAGQSSSSDTFNLLMADTSGSMAGCWADVVEGWNTHIANKLNGLTKLYVFDDRVRYVGNHTTLKEDDFSSGGTNITRAMEEIKKEVEQCEQSFVQVFIITDGEHCDFYRPLPEEVIETMSSPPQKTVSVHLLGISERFPVNLSIDIRSRLHSGSSSLPSLYWAKKRNETKEQLEDIGSNLGSSVKMMLNQEGFLLPGLPPTQAVHLGEWLYFPKAPEEVVGLKVSVNDGEEKAIPHTVKSIRISILLDFIYPQWNSLLIQRHRKKQPVPKEAFAMMDSLFEKNMEGLRASLNSGKTSIKERLEKKKVKEYEVNYRTMMNTSRTIIEVEGKYKNEIELANNILKSTVSGRKYDTQVLKLRGHGLEDYDKDKAEFFEIYRKYEKAIKALPPPHPDDCCRITMSSTLSDLQDESFGFMEDVEKFDFLKTFTMSGIPAYSPVRDAAKINPWTLSISNILVMPFTVLSQRAIEAFAEMEGGDKLGSNDKDVKLKEDDENTRFNIIIPTVPASAVEVLKPLLRSKLYAMLATFSILKDPHIVDFSAHLAALACAWVKSVTDHPPTSRPEYITERLTTITTTASLYMDRKGILQYTEALASTPNKALMTEWTDTTNNQTLKCESLVKPMFFLGMKRDMFTVPQLTGLLKLLLGEFVGRCLSNYKVTDPKATPFTDFFVPAVTDSAKKEEWLNNESKGIIEVFITSIGEPLKTYYAPEELRKGYLKFVSSKAATLGDHLKKSINLAVNMEKVNNLKYIGGCGNVTFDNFRAWAQEMAIPEEEILAAFDPEQVSVYVCEALSFRSSKERLDREQRSRAECLEHIKQQVTKENEQALLRHLKKKVDEIVADWREQYMTVHSGLVMPMTLQEVVSAAQALNVNVTEETFSQVYKYDPKTGLLHNACQIPGCPFYLKPSRRFNQHLSVERTPGKFPHSLHLVSVERHAEGADRVMKVLASGEYSGQNGRKKLPVSEDVILKNLKPRIEKLLKVYSEKVTE